MSGYVEVLTLVDRDRAESWSDALLEAGALSATIEDADAGGADERALFGEPGSEPVTLAWRRSRIVALFDAAADINGALRRSAVIAGLDAVPSAEQRPVADADWVTMTQAQFEPIRVGPRLWVVPSWHAVPVEAQAADAVVVRLDPGLAFGSGDHPTTRLCLSWLEQALPKGASLIDYGCGSGILAIAAKLLGAGRVVGTDIDDQAVAAARGNALANGVDIPFLSSSVFASAPADVVIANILSNPLKVLAPLLSSLVAPHGRLVLAGVLERQWREVASAYAPRFDLAPWREDQGWVCLVGMPETR